jgi:shikimate kinase
MDPDTEAALAGHRVVFLDVGIADAARRIGFNKERPLLMMNPRSQWVTLMEKRRPTYERLAVLRVDTAGRTPEDVAQEIEQRLASARPDNDAP